MAIGMLIGVPSRKPIIENAGSKPSWVNFLSHIYFVSSEAVAAAGFFATVFLVIFLVTIFVLVAADLIADFLVSDLARFAVILGAVSSSTLSKSTVKCERVFSK